MKSLSDYPFKALIKRFMVWALDGCGYALRRMIPRRTQSHQSPRKILIARLDSLGDIIMTLPAVSLLKNSLTTCTIHALTSSDGSYFMKSQVNKLFIFKKNWHASFPFIEQLAEAAHLVRELRKEKYDLAIDFRGDFRNILIFYFAGIPRRIGYGITGGGFLLENETPYPKGVHAAQVCTHLLEFLGIKGAAELKRIKTPSDISNRFHQRFPQFTSNHEFRIAIHCGAGYPSKRWPAENFSSLFHPILEMPDTRIVLIGTDQEKISIPLNAPSSPRFDDLRGKIFLSELPLLLELCQLYIGHDSGPAHIAAAQGIPLIVLFSGTNKVEEWHPISDQLQLFRHPVSCSPCESKVCPLMHHDCMKKISPETIIDFIQKWIPNLRAGIKSDGVFHEV